MKERDLQNKLISNAKAIISNHITIPLGTLKMTRIMFWVRLDKEIDLNLDVFRKYCNLIHKYPIGTERLRYNFEYLKREDEELDKITVAYKDEILLKCFEIISKLSKNKL